MTAFKEHPAASQTNMSEMYHSTYTNTRSSNLTHVDALYHDASEVLIMEAQLNEMSKGIYSGITRPNQAQEKELKRARSYADSIKKAHTAFKTSKQTRPLQIELTKRNGPIRRERIMIEMKIHHLRNISNISRFPW